MGSTRPETQSEEFNSDSGTHLSVKIVKKQARDGVGEDE